jgi:Zn-dependent peptidase ImmA (M78 family)
MGDTRLAKARAEELLHAHGVAQPPVDVRVIAEKEGIRVLFEELEPGISGFVVRNGSEVSIGINADHHSNRQRFTLAHELGHYTLHFPEMEKYPTAVFVDADKPKVLFRADTPATPNAHEIDANTFAASLLMPEEFMRRDVLSPIQLHDESIIKQLAQRYSVSAQALVIRLMELRLIQDHAGS